MMVGLEFKMLQSLSKRFSGLALFSKSCNVKHNFPATALMHIRPLYELRRKHTSTTETTLELVLVELLNKDLKGVKFAS